jgi:hypothetical protein
MTRKITDPWEVSKDAPPKTLDGAIVFLNNWLSQQSGKENDEDPERSLIEVVSDMIKENPTKWYVMHHFSWGMVMRNLLRENGYGEQELGISNLDDYYVALIEQACLGKGKHYHQMPNPDADNTSEK